MEISDEEREKILATPAPSFNMTTLRPLANLIAQFTSPAQVLSILKTFGFQGIITVPHEAEAALVEMFDSLHEENNDDEIKEILEECFTLYTSLVDEELHHNKDTLIFKARAILARAHFNLAFHTVTKRYLVMPFVGAVHGIAMHAEGTTEADFKDPAKRPARAAVGILRTNTTLIFMLSKDGQLTRQVPITGDKPYALEKNSRRHKVLKALIGCKSGGFCDTSDLAETAECTEDDFRGACDELKAQIVKHFSGVLRSDVIQGKSGSGYRIKPEARIIETP